MRPFIGCVPAEVEAMQWTGSSEDIDDLLMLTGGTMKVSFDKKDRPSLEIYSKDSERVSVDYLDWIIQTEDGKLISCNDRTFRSIYTEKDYNGSH